FASSIFLGFLEAHNQTLQCNAPFAVICVSLATNQAPRRLMNRPPELLLTKVATAINPAEQRSSCRDRLPSMSRAGNSRYARNTPYCAFPLAGIGCASTGQRRHAPPRRGKRRTSHRRVEPRPRHLDHLQEG